MSKKMDFDISSITKKLNLSGIVDIKNQRANLCAFATRLCESSG